MNKYSKSFILASFALLIHTGASAEVPVVDDSENYALLNEQSIQEPIDKQQNEDFELTDTAESLDSEHPEWGEPLAALDDDPYDAMDNSPPSEHQPEKPLAYDSKSNPSKMEDNAMLLDRVQTLQEEVQQLRGQLEVQAHDLKMLQQQQLAFYKDLDARLSQPKELQTSDKKAQVDQARQEAQSMKKMKLESVSTNDNANPADEQISYLKAYELIKNKNYDEALAAMSDFTSQYPQSGYAPNAQYWLGELYLLKKQFNEAMTHFDVVIQKYPTSSKIAPSLLKLGYVQAAMGERAKARDTLNQVIRDFPDTKTAQLAGAKLDALK